MGLSGVVQFLRPGNGNKVCECARTSCICPHGNIAFGRLSRISGRRPDMVPRPFAAYFRHPRSLATTAKVAQLIIQSAADQALRASPDAANTQA